MKKTLSLFLFLSLMASVAFAQNCAAGFVAVPIGPTSFQFLDSSFTNIGNPMLSWEFGDGNTSTDQNPQHTYNVFGTFTVFQIIEVNIPGGGFCTDTFSIDLVVSPLNCVATFTNSSNPFDPLVWFFDATGSQVPVGPADYQWDFGDGSTGSGDTITHYYSQPGVYLVTLHLIDSAGSCFTSYSEPITVFGTTCAANFTSFTQGQNTVHFTNQSYGGPGAEYSWDFGDGNTSLDFSPDHTYANPGTYYVCATVSDTALGCTDTFCDSVVVGANGNCVADFTSTPDSIDPLTVSFDAGLSQGTSLVYTWDFGDGNNGNGISATHTYAQPGVYPVFLLVIDSINGCVDIAFDSLLVGTGACIANFSYAQLGQNTASFTNLSFVGAGAAYTWQFGDGNSSADVSPQHTYAIPGTYNVCLTLIDNAGCADTICSNVTIFPPNGNCVANFVAYQDTSPNVILFDATASLPASLNASNLSWDFGDGNVGIGNFYQLHHYTNPGTYLVCLTVNDPIANCTDTFCDSVVVTGSPGCQAFFTHQSNGLLVSFDNFSFYPQGSLTTWDFGDGNTSSAFSPDHTYTAPGIYAVCLTVDGGAACSDTYCDSVTVSAVPNGLLLSGLVFPWDSGATINDGEVYLIQHDSAAGTLTAIDTVGIQQSYYQFDNVQPGTYLVKAALNPSSPFYSDNLPTYIGDQLFWYDALSVVATVNNVFVPPILMVQGVNPGGPGFIGGLISQGANKQGDPLDGIEVVLLDDNDQPIAFALTDVDGSYSFSNLAYGTYQVHLEIAGKFGDPIWITLSADNPSMDLIDFEVDEDSWTSVTTAIDPDLLTQSFQVFPNPAQTQVALRFQSDEAAEVNISLFNMMGQEMMQLSEFVGIGEQEVQVNLLDVPAGTYLLRLQTGQTQVSQRLMITE